MGQRGPQKRPTAVALAMGDKRAKYERTHEPQVKPELIDAPPDLSPPAQAVWQDVAQRLFDVGVLTRLDHHALAGYCEFYVRWRLATDILARVGSTFVVKADDGTRRQEVHPQVKIANEAFDRMLKLEREFGMTPASRPNIQVAKQGGDDMLAEIIKYNRQN